VSRFRSWVWLWVAGPLLGVGALSAEEAGRPGKALLPATEELLPATEELLPATEGLLPATEGLLPATEDLLPGTTVGFVAVSDVDELVDHWRKTQVGQLMADPVMQPFAKDLRRQFEERWSGARERLGLTLDDLKDVPGGEVSVAVILQPAPDKTAPDKACLAILVDVTGHLKQADALLKKVSENLTKQGAKRTEIEVTESPLPVVQFDNLPKPKDNPDAELRPAFYFLSGNLLGTSDSLQVIRGILARLPLPPGQDNSLAGVPGFQAVRRRCQRDNGGATPQFRWFLDPLGYVRAIRAATPEKHRRKGKSVLEILRNQGFGAIRGVGGFVDFYVSEEYQLVHRTVVYAPGREKYEKSMKMLIFPNDTQFAPQRWVPREVATYTTFYVDILNAFDNVGPLFNEMVGGSDALDFMFSVELECQADLDKGVLPKKLRREFEESDVVFPQKVEIVKQEGDDVWEIKHDVDTYIVKKRDRALQVYAELEVWEDVLQGLKDDTGIDLRAELIRHLGKRVTVIAAYEDPITTTSERLLFAIETTNEKAVKAAIKKTMQTSTDVKQRQFGEHLIWEIVEEEQLGEPEIPTITIPSLTGEDDAGEQEKGEKEKQDGRLLPHAAVTVAHGHLFVASQIDFLKEVLTPKQPRNMLGANVACRLVQDAVKELGIERTCAWSFSRTDEEYRPTYELIRQGKMPQSETMLARVLNAIFATGKKGEFRPQKIDGTQMPDYDVVRRYLGAAGLVVSSEHDGWFFKGFTLKKGTP